MADTKTTAETARSPIDGTESVRLATSGANWKATIAAIFGTTTGVTDQITVVGTLTAGGIPRTLLTGLGTGVATALGVNIGSAGAPVLFNGAGGTPSSLTGTNISGTAASLTVGNVTGAGVGSLTSLAIGGATIGSNALAVTGTSLFNNRITITQGTTAQALIVSTGGSNTGSDTTSAVDLSWTLNTSGSPDVVALRVTDTARGATTKLFNIYGGASGTTTLFNIDRGGVVSIPTGTGAGYYFGSTYAVIGRGTTTTGVSIVNAGSETVNFYGTGVEIITANSYGWSSSGLAGVPATRLSRAADGVVQVGTTANNALGSLNLTNLTATGIITLGSGPAIISSPTAAVFQHGATDVASGAVAQFIRAQSNTGASTTGPDFTWQGTKGTTIGGAVIIQTALTTTYATALKLTPAQAVLALSPTGGLGYGTGAGGAVTQATNKSTGVTLNTVTGQITMNNANLAGQTEVSFTLTNSAIAATDVVLVSIASGATANSYVVSVGATAAGSCVIQLGNVTLATTLGEAVVLNFAVIKGVTS